MRKALPILVLALLASPGSRAEDAVTPEQKKALEEMDAKLAKLKAEGKLPGDVTSATATSTAASASTEAATAADGCLRLKTGQAAIVKTSDDTSPTGVAAGYGLSRPADDTFLVEVNMRFLDHNSGNAGLGPKELDTKYRDKVAACFKEYEGLLKNERAGRTMILRLTDNPSVPAHLVEIWPSGHRSNEGQFNENIGCSGILHETMHMLGLPDEYRDTPDLHNAMMDCRPAAPDDSIMSHDREAAASVKEHTGYSVEMCRCQSKGMACVELAAKNDGKTCPPGTTSFLQDIDPKMTASINVLNTAEAFVLNETPIAGGKVGPTHTSVLYPAHFRVITEPGCLDVNKTYYLCAANAYRNSKEDGCVSKPPACKWGSYKWLE